MYYQVIVISNNFYPEVETFSSTTTLDHCDFVDSNSLFYQDEKYFFDYLIIDNLSLIKNINLEQEYSYVLTNYYQETSINNIFALGNIVKTDRSIKEQLEIIINYIKNGE